MADELTDAQRQFYDERWSRPRQGNRLQLARCIAILEAVSATNLFQPRILDLGCGTGWLAATLANFGHTVGVELSSEAVRLARNRYPDVEFHAADFLRWDHPPGSFDIVVSQEVIEHVVEQAAYVEVAARHLKSGGFLILTTPNARTFDAMPEDQRVAWCDQLVEKCLTARELSRLLGRRFRVLRLTTITPGYGIRGAYRFVNSRRVRSLFRGVGFGGAFDRLRLRLGFGLTLFAVARRP